jgi:hypothetical protein
VAHYWARHDERERRFGHNANRRRHEVSEVSTAPTDPQVVVEDPEHVTEAVNRPLVVITEQEVAFSTAAAVPLPRTKPTRRVIAALRAMFLSSSEDARPEPRHYPPRRDAFLEQAAMAREMHRL